MIDETFEGELSYVVIEAEDGTEMYYVEEVVIPHEGKEFAILVSVPKEDDPEHDEPEVIIARIDEEDGEDVYVAPEEDEFDAVIAIYEAME